MVVAICYLGLYIQNIVESGKEVSSGIEFEENSAIDPNVVNKLQSLERTIKSNFYLGEVENEDLQDGIYKGLLESLGDPYSE